MAASVAMNDDYCKNVMGEEGHLAHWIAQQQKAKQAGRAGRAIQPNPTQLLLLPPPLRLRFRGHFHEFYGARRRPSIHRNSSLIFIHPSILPLP
jgi:hypothetical protein